MLFALQMATLTLCCVAMYYCTVYDSLTVGTAIVNASLIGRTVNCLCLTSLLTFFDPGRERTHETGGLVTGRTLTVLEDDCRLLAV